MTGEKYVLIVRVGGKEPAMARLESSRVITLNVRKHVV